jgi:hypothetical protein
VGNHVIEAPAQNSKGHSPESYIKNNPGFSPARHQASICEPDSYRDSQKNEKGVGVDHQIQPKPVEATISEPLTKVE